MFKQVGCMHCISAVPCQCWPLFSSEQNVDLWFRVSKARMRTRLELNSFAWFDSAMKPKILKMRKKTDILKKSESFLLDTFGSTWRLAHRCTIFICYLGCEIDEIDDQHRNPNINNKDHQVGQLTTWRPEAIFSILVDQVNLTTALGSWAFQIAKLPFTFVFICHRIGPTFQHLSSRFAHHHLPIELQLLR